MPKPFPKEFHDDVVRVARNRDSSTTLEQVAKDFGVHATTLANGIKRAEIDDGVRPGISSDENAELKELRRRNRLLEQENEVLRRAAALIERAAAPAEAAAKAAIASGDQ